MYELCHTGDWGFIGNVGEWGWIGPILLLVFWLGLFTVLTVLVVWAIRRGRRNAAAAGYATGQPTAMEILQARFARGEISREQYELLRQGIG